MSSGIMDGVTTTETETNTATTPSRFVGRRLQPIPDGGSLTRDNGREWFPDGKLPPFERPGDYCGPIHLGLREDEYSCYFLLPNARDEGASDLQRAVRRVDFPPHTYRECPDGSLEIRPGIDFGSTLYYLNEGHIWESEEIVPLAHERIIKPPKTPADVIATLGSLNKRLEWYRARCDGFLDSGWMGAIVYAQSAARFCLATAPAVLKVAQLHLDLHPDGIRVTPTCVECIALAEMADALQ